MHLFQLVLLLFLVNYPNHLLYQLVVAVMALTSTHVGVVRTIYYSLDHTVAGIMLILNEFIRGDNNVKYYQTVKYVVLCSSAINICQCCI